MTKKDIAQVVAQRADVSAATAEEILGAALDVIGEQLAKGEDVRLAGFGTVVVALAGLALLTVGAQATPQNTDRTIYVSAVGNNGMPVVDPPINVTELTVLEDGAPREITKIAQVAQ